MRKNTTRSNHRKLKEQAAQRDLPRKKRTARFPLIDCKGPKVELTSDRLFELIEFP